MKTGQSMDSTMCPMGIHVLPKDSGVSPMGIISCPMGQLHMDISEPMDSHLSPIGIHVMAHGTITCE